MRTLLCFGTMLLLLTGCGDGETNGSTVDGGMPSEGPLTLAGPLTEGETIPPRHKCPVAVLTGGEGDNLSPALRWSGAPDGTQSFAVVVYDTRYDAFHWALWDIPREVTSLPEGIEPGFEVNEVEGAHQLAGGGPDAHGYFGPCSDAGPLAGTYAFRLHALDVETLGLQADTTPEALLQAIDEAELERTAWEGTPE